MIVSPSVKCAWDVLCLFLIPVGGGIPAGVLLARKGGLNWAAMIAIYFVSDVILAILFEPLLLLVRRALRRAAWFEKFNENYRVFTARVIARQGQNPSVVKLIMVSFGIDPMTGRAAALAAGHGFVGGWLIAIAGDLIFFVILMVSTLWLNNVLGDGTWTAVIIMALMFGVPALVRHFKNPPSDSVPPDAPSSETPASS